MSTHPKQNSELLEKKQHRAALDYMYIHNLAIGLLNDYVTTVYVWTCTCVGITTNDVHVFVCMCHCTIDMLVMKQCILYMPIYSAQYEESSFSVFWTFSQSWYMLLRHKT